MAIADEPVYTGTWKSCILGNCVYLEKIIWEVMIKGTDIMIEQTDAMFSREIKSSH